MRPVFSNDLNHFSISVDRRKLAEKNLRTHMTKKDNINSPAIIFDFGGVLIKWDPHLLYRNYFPGDKAAADRFLKEIGFNEWNLQQDGGRSFSDGVAELSGRFPAYKHLIEAYDRRWEESLGGPIQPTVEILRTLKDAGHCLYGLSNWSSEKFALVRERYEFFDWFEAIVISGDHKLVKPDPRLFEITLKIIGRPAQECVLIDDSWHNIAVAQELGFQTIHFETPEKLKKELNERSIC
jgi:2-haloacid dehalogenase